MAASGWRVFLISLALTLFLWTGTIVLLVLSEDTLSVEYSRLQPGLPRVCTLHERSLPEVWNDWGRRTALHPAFVLAGILVLSLLLGTGGLAWLLLPSVHSGGSVRDSIGRALRAVACGHGLLIALTALMGTAIVLQSHSIDRTLASDTPVQPRYEIGVLIGVAVLMGACLWFFWLSRAVAGVRNDAAPIELPPRCEGCGYCLTHVPDDGRCPECSLDAHFSLAADVRRPGCAWEERQGEPAADWLATSALALLRPRAFYGSLKLRNTPPTPLAWFAAWHYAVIGAGAAAWVFISAAIGSAPARVLCSIPCGAFFLAPLLGWLLQRLVAALSASWWVITQAVPDMRWSRKVLAYETPYIWLYCLFNGSFFTSIFLFDDWVTRLCGRKILPFFYAPPEAVVVLIGNIAITLFWLWRYHIAARAIRWSNF